MGVALIVMRHARQVGVVLSDKVACRSVKGQGETRANAQELVPDVLLIRRR